MMLGGTLLSAGKLNNSNMGTAKTDDIKVIRIAIYIMEGTRVSDEKLHFDILDGYQWKVGDQIYKFTVTVVGNKDILKGDLTTKNYDVFRIASAEQLMGQLAKPSIKNIILKNKIVDFIKEGGGYFGSCASALIMTSGMINQPETFTEMFINKVVLGASQVKGYVQGGIPILAQLTGHPEMIGPVAYQWFTGWDVNNESNWFGGVCLDVTIDKNNPIFNDLYGDTRRIMWCGGAALAPPEQNDNVKTIAYYPSLNISDNKSTQMHAWKYVGGLSGFIKGFLNTKGEKFSDRLYLTFFKATDWKMTDTIIKVDRANRPFMTLETYPNENQGRIVLCCGHPEYQVWWGGQMVEAKDTSSNNLFDSLNHWTNITRADRTYNWCIFRREAAWAGKVPDSDLPPIYGPSQVSDIYPYIQNSLNFKIIGNAEVTDGIASLDLYYRYSNDNSSNNWSAWKIYSTDTNGSDGWSWEFNVPNGTGYYQFYSIRHVEYADHTETETAPPGPDAIAYVFEDNSI